MDSVMPGGMSGILGGDAGGGALGGLGDLVNPAPASPTPDAPAAGPKSPIPLGF